MKKKDSEIITTINNDDNSNIIIKKRKIFKNKNKYGTTCKSRFPFCTEQWCDGCKKSQKCNKPMEIINMDPTKYNSNPISFFL